MAGRRLYSFYIDDDLHTALKALKARDGIPESEAVRRGLRAYLEKRAAIRPRSAAARKSRSSR